jgi:hypothetical protein
MLSIVLLGVIILSVVAPLLSVSDKEEKKFYDIANRDQYYKLFTAVITPLAAYFSMILTELRQ